MQKYAYSVGVCVWFCLCPLRVSRTVVCGLATRAGHQLGHPELSGGLVARTTHRLGGFAESVDERPCLLRHVVPLASLKRDISRGLWITGESIGLSKGKKCEPVPSGLV